jgi:glycolate oxidase
MSLYPPLTQEILRELRTYLDESRVVTNAKELENVSFDQAAKSLYSQIPEVLVYPISTQEVASIVKLANVHRIPITARGAGSGLAGGAVPLHKGIVIAFDKMNRLLEIDKNNLTVTVEPGIITNKINEALESYGLYFAGYPMSLERCMIGGNIATNAGGGKAIKYGVTGRYIVGLEVVTATGEILTLGGKLFKNVTGYDLKQLFIGSEGTLGIITQATIQLTPLPKAASTMLVWFSQMKDAVQLVPEILTTLGITPTAIELIDQTAMKYVCEALNESFYRPLAQATLLIEVDGANQAVTNQQIQQIASLCERHGAIDVLVAADAPTRERMWKTRRSIAETLKQHSPEMSLEDMVLPIHAIPDYMPHVKRLEDMYEVSMPTYGHAGDGNLHTTLLKKASLTDAEWHALEAILLEELYTVVHQLGGKISGEHGIGIKRKSYFTAMADPAELTIMQAIKKTLDPNNILNPGKIFDLN